MVPPHGAQWRSCKRAHDKENSKPRQAKRKRTAAITGFQGGHNHESEIDDTQNETKLTARLAQRCYTWLKAGLLTATPRLKAYTKMAKTRHNDVCKVYAKRHAKKRTKAVASNTKPPPTTMEKAPNMEEETSYPWLDSILDEWNGLGNLVLDHGHTM